MPAMPAMPAMPSMPSIPGLRKGAGGAAEEGIANEGLATSPDKAAGSGEKLGADIDDEDRSRYNRYGPCINDGKEIKMVFSQSLD